MARRNQWSVVAAAAMGIGRRCNGGTIAVGNGNVGDGAMEGETAARSRCAA